MKSSDFVPCRAKSASLFLKWQSDYDGFSKLVYRDLHIRGLVLVLVLFECFFIVFTDTLVMLAVF